MRENIDINSLLDTKETENLRQLWQSGGEITITGWKNRDYDWYPLWKKGMVNNVMVRSGQEPIYKIEWTAQGGMLATLLFEPVPLCPHCGKPLRDSEKG